MDQSKLINQTVKIIRIDGTVIELVDSADNHLFIEAACEGPLSLPAIYLMSADEYYGY